MGKTKNEQPRIAAVIAAYNEAKNVHRVLKVLDGVNILDEILVVDDGSMDHTGAEVMRAAQEDPRIRLITHEHNRGKGQAVFTGRENTQAPILLLLDADLINLRPTQVNDLIRPIKEGKADMTIGLFRKGVFNTDLGHIVTPWLSGQRCLVSELLTHVSKPAAAGYGLETAITVTAALEGWRIQRVRLEGVYHPPSEFHRGILRGIGVRARMYAQIYNAWHIAGGPQVALAKLYNVYPKRTKMRGQKSLRNN